MENKSKDWVERQKEKGYFICKGCIEVIRKPENYSKEENYCIGCWERKEALKNNRCLSCGGKNPVKEYWATCEKCWNKSLEEIDKENERVEQYRKTHKGRNPPDAFKDWEESRKIEELREREGWEAVEDYLEKKRGKK